MWARLERKKGLAIIHLEKVAGLVKLVGDAGQSNWYMWNSVPIGRVGLVQPIPFNQFESPKVLARV